MPNITDALIEQYQHPRIKLVVGNTTIYEDDIVSGSFSYKGGTTGSGAFAPGGCVISSCSFTVYNRTGSYTNTFAEKTEVEVYIGYGATPQTATYDLLCTAYVAEATKRTYKIAVSCYDKLRDADKNKWSTYSFPMTVNEIIQSAATEAGITINQLPPNTVAGGGGIRVDLRDDEGNQPELSMTCRQAIAQALLISGHYGYMTPAGQLYCGWYNASVDKTIPTKWIFDYNVTDAQDYTGVQVYGQTPTGTTTRLYVLSSGRFITEDNCAAIQARLHQALVSSGLSIRKGTFSIVCNPNVKPGMVIQTTVPQAGSNVTITIPLTSVTVKGSLKATYSSENISADEMDDLRKTDYVTKEDLDNALQHLPQPTWEYVTLPSVQIWMKLDANNNRILDTFPGMTIELDKQDDYHVDIGQIIARNTSNPTTDQDGISIMSITFPQQLIKIPATNGQEDIVDILIGEVAMPTLAQYRAVYGSSFSTARQTARLCHFWSNDNLPYIAKVRVKRYIGEHSGHKYNFIKFAEDPTQYTQYGSGVPVRIKALYNGLVAMTNGYSTNPYPPIRRIPWVWLPIQGQCFDLEPTHGATYKKFCSQVTPSYTHPDALQVVPSKYIEYRT